MTRRAWLLDLLLAVALVAVSARLARPALGTGNPKLTDMLGGQRAASHLRTWWWAVTAVQATALAGRRAAPVPAFAVLAAGLAAHLAWTPVTGVLPVDLGVLLSLYQLGSTRNRWRSGAALAVTLAALAARRLPPTWWNGLVGADLAHAGKFGPVRWAPDPLLVAVLAVAVWLAGENARGRRAYLERLEHDRLQQARLAAAAERTQVARELHDVVAHGLSVMVIQAQGARAALRPDPDAADQALDAVVSTGREAMAEMRHLLGVVGGPERDSAAGPALAPPPGLSALHGLLERVRDAGTPVELAVSGEPRPLPVAVDLAAYRIVQESLTNTMRHAGAGAAARVTVSYGPDALALVVSDTGRGPGGRGGGRGLAGMRERVELLGGSLSCAPAAAGGFEVRATLPLGGTR